MSLRNSLFEKVPIEIQKLNTCDMSHDTLGTGMVGSVIPVKVEEIMPGTIINLGNQMHVQLPPFVNNAYGRISVKQEAFFVPNRLLVGQAWQDYMLFNGGLADQYAPPGLTKRYMPVLVLNTRPSQQNKGGLFDYLYGTFGLVAGESWTPRVVDALPLLAYWKIIDDWYRCPSLTQPIFQRGNAASYPSFVSAPYLTYTSQVSWRLGGSSSDPSLVPAQYQTFFQRAYGKDYFTNAYLNQNGGAQQVNVALDSDAGTFSIQQLRVANSLQRFAEVNAAAGGRYADAMVATYGVCPSDAVLQRPVFLGRNVVDVYGNSVYQTSENADGSSATPWANGVGAKNGDRSGVGECRLVDNFQAKEQGFLIVMQTLVPHSYYSTLARHKDAHININAERNSNSGTFTGVVNESAFSDLYPIPSLAGIGNEPIYMQELVGLTQNDESNVVYGWTPRYSSYKFNNDEVHGLLNDGESLSSFAIKRGFALQGSPTGLITGPTVPEVAYIKTTDLDDVTTVGSAMSEYGYIFNIHWQEDHTLPLPAYTIPTLGEPKNTKTISVDKGGKALR